jgi:hypothetical protein
LAPHSSRAATRPKVARLPSVDQISVKPETADEVERIFDELKAGGTV